MHESLLCLAHDQWFCDTKSGSRRAGVARGDCLFDLTDISAHLAAARPIDPGPEDWEVPQMWTAPIAITWRSPHHSMRSNGRDADTLRRIPRRAGFPGIAGRLAFGRSYFGRLE